MKKIPVKGGTLYVPQNGTPYVIYRGSSGKTYTTAGSRFGNKSSK